MPEILDAPSLVRAMALYAEALERFRLEIDSLNVFPVPDGDTGTNLLQTQRAVMEALSGDGAAAGGGVAVASLPALRETVTGASLAGARGNSGVILSQVLRALCAALPDEGADGAGVARALRDASVEARRVVAEPKEGTVLTVLDGAARAASEAGPGAGSVLEAALRSARAALGRTQSLLPELRAAGVVDAGGKGAVLLLDALHAAVTGGDLTEPGGMAGPVGAGAETGTRALWGRDAAPAYEVQFLIEAPDDESLAELRSRLAVLGDSLAVVGGGGLYRVHVHTDRPEDVLAAARATAEPRDPSVDRLAAQVSACLGASAREVRAGRPACGLVALAVGSGLGAALRSLGANVVAGGSGRGARTDHVAPAVASVRADGVVVICTQTDADAVRRSLGPESGADRALVVVAAYPAAISAAAAFHPDAPLAKNVAAMTAAAQRCRAGEVTARGDEAAGAVTQLVARLGAEVADAEMVTLVVGDAVPGDEVAAVAAALTRGFPRLRVETIPGGQRTPYLVGLE